MPPRRSANKETTEKAAAFPEEAMPQRAPRKGKERQVATGATSRTAEPKRHKRVALLVISFITIIPLSSISSFQSYKVDRGDDIVFPKSYEDDDTDEVADPLFKPIRSLRTRDTGDSRASTSRVFDIPHFFVVYGKDQATQKRICKICGYVFVRPICHGSLC
jgi:hypothetical protein